MRVRHEGFQTVAREGLASCPARRGSRLAEVCARDTYCAVAWCCQSPRALASRRLAAALQNGGGHSPIRPQTQALATGGRQEPLTRTVPRRTAYGAGM